jgi:hypothetical protein
MADELKRIVETAGKTLAGAIGTAAGLAAGTAAALAGKHPERKQVEPANEELYWREHFAAEPYVETAYQFEDYLPAWRTGWEGRGKYQGRSFDDVLRDLEGDFYWNRGKSRLTWQQAVPAVRAGWEHV